MGRENESGVIVIGKVAENNMLCLTAFIVAKGQTLYIPPDTIHTNDYQRGLWRSYSERKKEIVGNLVNTSKNKENLFFKFYDGITKERINKYEVDNNDDSKEDKANGNNK